MNLEDALKGGPGLDGYTFNADTYCVDCGQDIIREVFAGTGLEDISEESNVLPYPIFFGESDLDTYCVRCGDLMYEGGKEAARIRRNVVGLEEALAKLDNLAKKRRGR